MRVNGLPFPFSVGFVRNLTVSLCAVLLVPGDVTLYASPQQSESSTQQEAPKIPSDQLDSLVAPIALYPDPLLSQVLVASTYPLEIIQLQQWLAKNKDLKADALAEAVKKQNWDPSIQAMAALPDAVKQLAENIKWTTDLGNAFLAQQSDVMDAVQRMRKKAKDSGNLKSTEQQKVETKTVESKQVVVIQPASPEVIYVPSYNPTVVYGAPVYPYPPIYYPPPGYYAAGMAMSFGVGMAMGAAWSGGGWGWGAGWGNNDIEINRNNTFVNNSTRGSVNRTAAGNTWQHNPQHRGGAPYSNRATANRYGGTARGDSMATRQASARAATGSRSAGTGGAGTGSAGSFGANRGGGGDSIGGRELSSGASSRNSSAFSGAGGMSGSSARASSTRGSSSFSGRSGGGFRGGGGGRRR